MLTHNEKKVLRLILTAFGTDYSINNIAKECGIAPNGAYKILKKLEKEGILKGKSIANIKSYTIDFANEKTTNILELALIPELDGKIKYRIEDLKSLKGITKSCIIFGSYTSQKKQPNDLDILFILDQDNFRGYKKKLADIKDLVPVKIHDVLQTEQDIKNNIKNNDKIILEILRNGVVLWGQKIIIEVIKNVNGG